MPREWSLGVEATFCWIEVYLGKQIFLRGCTKHCRRIKTLELQLYPRWEYKGKCAEEKRKKSKIRLENRHICSAYLRDYKKANHNCVTVVHNPLSKVTYYLNKSGDPRVDMHTRTAAKPGGLGIASLLYSTLILKVQNFGRQTDRRSSHRKKKKIKSKKG